MRLATFYLTLIIASTCAYAQAQDLSSLDTVAQYSLINTAVDAQGNNDTIQIINSPYQGDDGVYCNGIYIDGIVPDGSLVRTPPIDELYDTTFAVQVQFKVESAPASVSPIFVCGDSWRYLGMMVRYDSIMMYNINSAWYPIPGVKAIMGQWHEVSCIYYSANSTTTFWMDGVNIAEHKEPLDRPDNDGGVSNTDGGVGFTFKGNLRNLTIYSSKDILSKTKSPWALSTGQVYPNPTSKELIIEDVSFASWSVYSYDGAMRMNGANTQGNRINVSSLPAGMYILALHNDQHAIVHRQRFQKI